MIKSMEKKIKLEGMRCSAFYRPQRLEIKVLSSFIDKTAGSSALHVESINSDSLKPYCIVYPFIWTAKLRNTIEIKTDGEKDCLFEDSAVSLR